MSDTEVEPQESPGDYSRVDGFVSTTGKVHYATKWPWGIGPECTSRFLIGQPTSILKSQVDCGKCINKHAN
jgi:hypothetical protein